ncbi:MAG: HD domain-containing protein [Cyclobacteriaceae bacterium]|nr:HD domain-containing protein [Cyclobacteriaceae bacterium]
MNTALIEKSKAYAEATLSQLHDSYAYHNIYHTKKVAEAVREIGEKSRLTDDQLETAIIAAWIHDTGYILGCENHETNSVEAAKKILTEWGASTEKIEAVCGAIEATEMPQHPQNIVDMVVCDADLYHLSNEDLLETGQRLRKEMAHVKKKEFTDKEWIQYNLKFLEGHSYFTEYGKTVLEKRKRKNIKKLKREIDPKTSKKYLNTLEKELEKLQRKLDKTNRPERGVETMFRITSQNHITLSEMADSKANIMVSINAIILSVIVSVLFRKLEEFPDLLIPTLMLVGSCLLTIVYAVLATRPNISSGKFTTDDIKKKKTNLLFFGNFHGMELENYEWGVKEMMKDADFLYSSIIKDIYFNGKVLARKYKLLRISYSIFMYGFVASILAFLISMLIFYYPS